MSNYRPHLRACIPGRLVYVRYRRGTVIARVVELAPFGKPHFVRVRRFDWRRRRWARCGYVVPRDRIVGVVPKLSDREVCVDGAGGLPRVRPLGSRPDDRRIRCASM